MYNIDLCEKEYKQARKEGQARRWQRQVARQRGDRRKERKGRMARQERLAGSWLRQAGEDNKHREQKD
jgi:hypothetical protein